MHPTTFCTVFGATIGFLTVLLSIDPQFTIGLLNDHVTAPLGLSPFPLPDEYGRLTFVVGTSVSMMYFLCGRAGSGTFARLSILSRLFFAGLLWRLIQQGKIRDCWYAFVIQDAGTALLSIFLEILYYGSNNKGIKKLKKN